MKTILANSRHDENAVEGNRCTNSRNPAHGTSVTLLTGGGDKPYVLGLAAALIEKGISLDLVGSDELDLEQFRSSPSVRFLNLRGNQRGDAASSVKVRRVLAYYLRLFRYAVTAQPKIFHILWHNKFLAFDRTLLMLYYKILGKKIIFTAHNVNAGKRDNSDTIFNRLTLRAQYRLANHTFVHTTKMKDELVKDFNVPAHRITVIPFGVNNASPNTNRSRREAKLQLGITDEKKNILFFGNITPYKGLEHLVCAFQESSRQRRDIRLIIAGRPTNCDKYWTAIQDLMSEQVRTGQILVRAEHIPDQEMELYFKAADVLVLPYIHVYQSGVLFTSYNFGLPVLAADVGSLREDVVEGETGFIFKPEDPTDLAKSIERYFRSDLFADLDMRRSEIREYAMKRNSWEIAGQLTRDVYLKLLGSSCSDRVPSPANAARSSAQRR
ncbi:MAG: glycosyltransferase family 4 protein [Candidatus Acidiferrales bacterium]